MRKIAVFAALVAAAITPASAGATVMEAHSALPPGAPAGYLKINPVTCRFLHPEIDVAPSAMERYARAEDSRDDPLFQCLRKLVVAKPKLGAPGPRGPRGFTGATGPQGPAGPAGSGGLSGYTVVSAAINFKQASATVTCPAGTKVLGGGASVEVAGSRPATDGSGWIVTRDHMWGHEKTGAVYATCAAVA